MFICSTLRIQQSPLPHLEEVEVQHVPLAKHLEVHDLHVIHVRVDGVMRVGLVVPVTWGQTLNCYEVQHTCIIATSIVCLMPSV